MYDFYFKTMISISSFMSYNVTTFAINDLITAKSVVFEKPFQWLNLLMRKGSKSRLAQILMSKWNEENTDASKENTVHVNDIMALIQVTTVVPETLQELSWYRLSLKDLVYKNCSLLLRKFY